MEQIKAKFDFGDGVILEKHLPRNPPLGFSFDPLPQRLNVDVLSDAQDIKSKVEETSGWYALCDDGVYRKEIDDASSGL